MLSTKFPTLGDFIAYLLIDQGHRGMVVTMQPYTILSM